MKTSRSLILVGASLLLTACGGGGGGGGSTAVQSETDINGGSGDELVFNFAPEPLQPRAFNLAAPTLEEQAQFQPGDTISLIWDADIEYANGKSIGSNESYRYDALVFLSADEETQLDEDLELFSVECSFPTQSEHACGNNAHFRCAYAEDNQASISCTSLPLNKPQGFSDQVVDTTPFIDFLPKPAHVIFEACLQEQPEKCARAVYAIQLN